MWNKKPNRCHLVLYLFLSISPYKLLNMFRANLCPSSGADDLVVHHTRKNTTKSSAPEDGHKVARNMLSNL